MSLNVLCIGAGMAGCRFSDYFSRRLSTVTQINSPIYINSSLDELNIFNNTSQKMKFRIGNSDGSGKNRSVAIQIFTKNFDYTGLLNSIKQYVIDKDIDVIAVSFSCAGGTGSGISPLLVGMLTNSIEKEKIVNKEIYVVGIGLLPAFNEGITSFRNTLLTINDINKGIGKGNRYFLVKNDGSEGANFTEKCEAVNASSTALITRYFAGTVQVSNLGVLDMNDRKSGLSHFGLHSLCKLEDGSISKSPFVVPGSNVCKMMLSEIPEENADIYENSVLEATQILDYKFGYTVADNGIVAFHGYSNLEKEMVPYRKRFEDLKNLDINGNSSTGDNAFKSLKNDVYDYSIKKDN